MPDGTEAQPPVELTDYLKIYPQTRFIEAFTPDLTGYGFGKRLPVEDAAALYRTGMNFSAAPYVLDNRHLGYASGGYGWDDGDPDARGQPIPGSLKPMPWARQPTAQVMLELTMGATGTPVPTDPRHVLRTVLERLDADGFRPVIACEFEFYLIDGKREDDGRIRPPVIPRTGRPLGYPTNLSVQTLEEVADWTADVVDAARAQALPIGALIAEMGVGQFETNLAHEADAVSACDHAIMLKRLIRGTARARDWDATFMAKPYAEDAGSGMHVHISFADPAGDNLFARGETGETMLRHAIGGMQTLMAESFALFSPNRNSFRRFGGLFAPANRAWGEDNRTVALRIPPERGKGRRVEHRVCGADVNPYLAVAAMLAAMHHGIMRRIEPTAPVVGKHAGSGRDSGLPADLYEAARKTARARVLKEYFPKDYLKVYSHLVHHLHEEFSSPLTPREYEFFL